ncbi:tail fiber domain-containing protein [Klebsiella pneumoniae]|uniref:tail fiber domain-containing protein n=1 Tax=Klebsiella pneumoniae TaxID=573 RepID=UPI003EB6E064
MTTYKTGNPLGSAAVKDLFDNAENLDHFENDRSNETWENRFGVPGKTRYGMEQEHDRQISSQEARFQQFLLSSGYVFLGDYQDGPFQFGARNQYIRYDNQYYRLNAATDVGFTTTGTDATSFANDVTHFVLMDGDTLRQNLGSSEEGLGGDLVGWKRSQLSAPISTISQYLDATMITPWEFARLITVKDNPDDFKTWDWAPAVQAAINAAYTRCESGALFNGAVSASMGGVDLCGMSYSVSSMITLPAGNNGGAGGCFIIQNGNLNARDDFPVDTPILRLSSGNTEDWTQVVHLNNVEVDGNNTASICVDVQKSVGTYIDGCHIVRYRKAGVKGSNLAYNCTVTRCYIESFPFGTAAPTVTPDAGIDLGNSDSVVTNCVIIGNVYGIRMAGKTRVLGNHIYGNKYSIYYNTQFGLICNNYLEDPLLTPALRDCSIINNFFSESIKGGAIVITGDGAGNARGSVIKGNIRSKEVLRNAGSLTFSSTTGVATCTSTSSDFYVFANTDGHVADGAVLTFSADEDIYAVIIPDAANTATQVKVRIVGTLPATSIAAGAWTQSGSVIALTGSDQTISPTASIDHSDAAVNNRTLVRLSVGLGGSTRINSTNVYNQNQGDGRGDLWVGNASATQPAGLGIGVANTGVNRGAVTMWARGGLEYINLGSYTSGTVVSIRPGFFVPGGDNTTSLGAAAQRWSVVYAATGSINTSDETTKEQFRDVNEAEKKAAIEIKSVIKGFKFKDRVSVKGELARWHFGVGAQTVGNILRKNGLDPSMYAFWCYDEWDEHLDGDLNPIQGGSRYGIRYDELIMFILSAI